MVRIVEPLLGTRAEVSVTVSDGSTRTAADTIEQRIVDEAQRLESVLTAFDEGSDLSTYRRTGRIDSPELSDVLELAALWEERTAGAFQPRIEPLMSLWTEAEQHGVVPTPRALAAAVRAMSEPSTATRVDVHALAKGWIAERALTAGVETGGSEITSIWLSLGGDLVHRGAEPITVGIEDPKRPYDNVAPLATVRIADESLATSGGARRFWTIGGIRHGRVLDPRTGTPVDHIAGATVVASDGATADVLATVALVLEPDATVELAERWGADCLVVTADGSPHASSSRFDTG